VNDATIVLEKDGRYVDASPGALEILGLTLDQLRALPPGSLSDEEIDDAEREARRAAFAEAGASRAVGSATIKRPDGRRLRVSFLIAEQSDGRYLAHLRPVDDGPDRPTVTYTIGEVLAAWRAAERTLETLEPDSAEWAAVQAQIASFRADYRRLSDPGRPRTN
jgi:PAS domain-containing protein